MKNACSDAYKIQPSLQIVFGIIFFATLKFIKYIFIYLNICIYVLFIYLDNYVFIFLCNNDYIYIYIYIIFTVILYII